MTKRHTQFLLLAAAAAALLATSLPAEARGGGHGGGGGRGGGARASGGGAMARAPGVAGVRPGGGYAPRYYYSAPRAGAVLGFGLGLGAVGAYGYPTYPVYPGYPVYGAPVYNMPPDGYYGYGPGQQLVPCAQLAPPDAQAAGCPVPYAPQAYPGGYPGGPAPSTAPNYYSPG